MKRWKIVSLLAVFALLITAVPVFAMAENGAPWTGDPDPYACNVYQDCFYTVTVCIDGTTYEVGIYYDPATQTAAYMEADALGWSDIVLTIGACPYVCEVRPLYRMVTLVDNDAPDWYLYDGRCYIIMHEDGTVPSVDRQAEVCSVCEHPDFIYEGDGPALYDSYVGVDCYGNYVYADPLWDPEWINLDPDNICHEESCITK
ncbi:hypothetical protein KKH23_02745 [Patescibacteria group bacterium]|nr:hypothetical protein [Patescibacteria group bacterium]MBU0777332.1 hypothetical protein [Patescibacteria group bacterium]MBU0846088.1 hypothetical protein [Patescibacteria group bacterium]MBU0923141.1 hypothetical protein [Patescibacteria group bacterium]MBU1066856.1 hypothetical protein [Patescibacteria group bacterium]